MSRWLVWLVAAGIWLGGLASPLRQDATPTPSAMIQTPDPNATAETTFPFALPTWVSPTPDATGAIIVIVQPGESMWVIAARAGISLPDLLALNNLTEQSIINPGDALIIGYVTPEAVVAPEDITPTATLPPPTPRPTDPPREASVCLSAFDDPNRNGVRDAGEPLRAGVAFTVYNSQAVVANYITDGRSEPRCLSGLTPGDYRVTRSITAGEMLTTEGDWSLSLTTGSELHQAFGSVMGEPVAQTTPAFQSTATYSPTPFIMAEPASSPNEVEGSSLWLRLWGVGTLFLGGLLLLGAVLILLFRQSGNQPATKPPEEGGERRFRNIDDLE